MTNSYPPPPAQPAPYANGGTPAQRTNVLAIISLVASLVGLFVVFFGPLAGIICGHIARSQIKKTGEQGRGMALAGLIVGYVLLVVHVLGLIAYILFFVLFFRSNPEIFSSFSTAP